jgi:CBS domain-containing protein
VPREVVTADPETEIFDAARLMRHHHVGTLVVIERHQGRARPVGIVTDRDLVIEVLATQAPAAQLKLRDIMGLDLVTGREGEDVSEIFERMRTTGVRRIPVSDASGDLIGIMTLDYLLDVFANLI